MPVLTVGSRKVHVRDLGEGDPVLLLHSSSSSSAQWRQLQAELAPRYRTLAVDLLGYGETSPWDCADELTFRDELELVEAVVAHTGGGPVHLVGHSYGGLIALKLATEGAIPLKSLTLVEPIAFWLLRLAGETELYGEMRAVADRYLAAFRTGDNAGALEPYIDYWNGPGSWARISEPLKQAILRTAGKTFREWALGFETEIPFRALARLAVPTLVVKGSETKRTTARICDLIRTFVPNAGTVEIRGGGHMCPLTHAEAVNRAIAMQIGDRPAARRAFAA